MKVFNAKEDTKDLFGTDISQALLAILFAVSEPIEIKKLAEGLEIDQEQCKMIVDELNGQFD